jgi:DNA-binding NarL/FixJ family response regulator
MTVRVLICDELPVIRDGMRTLLDAVPDFEVVATTDNGMDAIVLARTKRPDVVITDLALQAMSGLEMIRRLGKENLDPPPNIVVFTLSDTDETVSDVLHAGASGLLGKDASPEELVTAVRVAATGRTTLAPGIAHRLVAWFRQQPDASDSVLRPAMTDLTPREREVTLLVARGLSTDEVAHELAIGVATVRTHLYRVRCKLGARDRAQLVSFAFRSGLMRPAARPDAPVGAVSRRERHAQAN